MLTKKQTKEIIVHLENSQNPLFFFDNDNDGLISFLLLRRFIGRGRGIVIKSYPELNFSYYKKVEEFNPDYIFILDKPCVSKDFLEAAKQNNIPIVWIDHHKTEKPDSWINYYNPIPNKSSEPVSYISYKLTNRMEDIWLAVIGCISDYFIPEFYKEFSEKYPELSKKNPESAFDLLYNSKLGEIARILDFSLKDKTKNVNNMLKFMSNIKSPYELLEENSNTAQILKRYNEINSKYQELLEKARNLTEKKLIYFQYHGDLSLSSNISNQLKHEFPDKIIVVVYIKDNLANISLRGKNVRRLTLRAIKNIDGASGGGHKDATGAKMPADSLTKFREVIEKMIKD